MASLRIIAGCTLVDFGETTVVCFRCGNAFWMLLVGNVVLMLAVYLSRCFWPVWAFFMFVWLHFDCVLCIVNRVLDKKPGKNVECLADVGIPSLLTFNHPYI